MDYVSIMIDKYKGGGLLLDSNLLLLHLVGTVDPGLVGVGHYNKLSTFNLEQILILRQLISCFKWVVTTAHILTEVSNLLGDMHEAGKQRVFEAFAETLSVIEEQKVSSYAAAHRPEFSYLGLTDSVLAEFADKFLIVSNDGRMVNLFRDRGIEALKWVEVLGLSV
jgi:hypothetical protein